MSTLQPGNAEKRGSLGELYGTASADRPGDLLSLTREELTALMQEQGEKLVELRFAIKDGENGGRAFVVCDRGGCFIDGTPATRREFFSLYEKAAQQTAALFRHGDVPYAFIDRYGLFDIVMNASIANITIHDEDALLSLVPIY